MNAHLTINSIAVEGSRLMDYYYFYPLSVPWLLLDSSPYDNPIIPQAYFNIFSYKGIIGFFHMNAWIGTGTRLRHLYPS